MTMNGRKMYDRIFAIFGTLMVFFYFGLAIFILTTDLLNNKAMSIVLAVPLFLYAIYRVFVSYEKIRDSFFRSDDREE